MSTEGVRLAMCSCRNPHLPAQAGHPEPRGSVAEYPWVICEGAQVETLAWRQRPIRDLPWGTRVSHAGLSHACRK